MHADAQNVAFGAAAIATAVTAVATHSVQIGIAAAVPVCYALARDLAIPYAHLSDTARAAIGAASITGFGLLVASVALHTAPALDAAWYTYLAASALYAALMFRAPPQEPRRTTIVVLQISIAAAAALPFAHYAAGAPTAAVILAAAGAAVGTVVDGIFTAAGLGATSWIARTAAAGLWIATAVPFLIADPAAIAAGAAAAAAAIAAIAACK